MDLKAVGQRIKSAREAKNLTQEELAALVNLSPTHVSVIERGLKVTKLDTFVAIANALDVSADTLLIDVVAHSVTGVTNELTEKIEKLIDIMVEQISQCPNIKGAKYLGISEFKDSSVAYRIMIYCSPEYKLASRRYALRIIKLTLDANNIIIPYNQLDIHQK